MSNYQKLIMIFLLQNNKIGAEERALPALGRITPIDYNQINEEEFEHQKPDQTEPSNLTLKVDKKFSIYYDKISTILGEDLAKKVCADKWYFQQEGINSTIANLQTVMNTISDSDKTFIIGFISDIWVEAEIKSSNASTKSLKIIKKYKKTIKNLKRRVELFNSLIDSVKQVNNDLMPEVLKRLVNFIDMNDLKSDFISLLENIYSNYGYQSIQKTIEGMTDRQLEQIKDKITEAKEVISERNKIKERKRELMIEDKKRLDPESATAHLNKSKANKNKDPRLLCEFWGIYDKNFIDEDNKDLHYLEKWPKLTSWPGCEQIIEKSALNGHILAEWENKDSFKQWESWSEPYKIDEHEIHLTTWSKSNNS